MTKAEKVSFAFTLLSAVAAIAAAAFAFYQARAAWDANAIATEQARLAKEANERAAGRVESKLVVARLMPDSETLPLERRKKIFDSPFTTAYFSTPNDLVSLNPRIALRNVGVDPVDAVRVTIAYDGGAGEADQFKIMGSPDPIVVEQIYKEIHELDRKLNRGEVVVIPLTKGLLHQMLQAQRGRSPSGDRYGEFLIKCYGRIVGATGFDALADDQWVRQRILWQPKGFPEDSTQKLLDGLKLPAEVMKDSGWPKR